MTWADYLTVGLMGLLGGAHCAGMCAPFAFAISAGAGGRAAWLAARHTAYQLGKATAYVFLGVLLMLAAGWADLVAPLAKIQNLLAGVAGGVMVILGLGYALAWRWTGSWAAEGGWAGRACGALRVLWTGTSLWRCVLTGWINGFLPCGLSFAALLFLVSRDSLEGVVAGAYVFGFGTMPVLLAVGWLGERVSAKARGRGLRIAGGLLVVFGVLTIFRGADAVHHWFHEHTVPGGAASGGHDGHAH
ncbi:MAG: sulfite exporter TauE/SafE family protein [Opitutaceae bacterium]|nr:sulfite exporter TauE/SafE family protein [Opitutaceae bacterium]